MKTRIFRRTIASAVVLGAGIIACEADDDGTESTDQLAQALDGGCTGPKCQIDGGTPQTLSCSDMWSKVSGTLGGISTAVGMTTQQNRRKLVPEYYKCAMSEKGYSWQEYGATTLEYVGGGAALVAEGGPCGALLYCGLLANFVIRTNTAVTQKRADACNGCQQIAGGYADKCIALANSAKAVCEKTVATLPDKCVPAGGKKPNCGDLAKGWIDDCTRLIQTGQNINSSVCSSNCGKTGEPCSTHGSYNDCCGGNGSIVYDGWGQQIQSPPTYATCQGMFGVGRCMANPGL